MSSMRQLGSGLLYAIISVVLVVGGLALAMAEGAIAPAPPPTAVQPRFTAAPPIGTVVTNSPSPTSAIAPSSTPQVVAPTTAISLPASATPTASLTPRPTATIRSYATTVPCGPYAGWLRSYTVQPGDTLFHISTLYRTTVTALQVANCKSTTLLIPGERLWVPNVPTITPGLTYVPTFTTATAVPTEPLTLTPPPSYFTETAAPTTGTGP